LHPASQAYQAPPAHSASQPQSQPQSQSASQSYSAPQAHAAAQPQSAPQVGMPLPRVAGARAPDDVPVPQPDGIARFTPAGAPPAGAFAGDARMLSGDALAARMPASFAPPPAARADERATDREPSADRVDALDVDMLVAALSERFEEAAAEIGIAPWD
jgi:hypothetical protein